VVGERVLANATIVVGERVTAIGIDDLIGAPTPMEGSATEPGIERLAGIDEQLFMARTSSVRTGSSTNPGPSRHETRCRRLVGIRRAPRSPEGRFLRPGRGGRHRI
jgi:hypothetical protein